ncbi:MAG: hypothetical protein ACI85N_001789 [Gammaproteobacteria bacterium]|jgi:hypothetical protein
MYKIVRNIFYLVFAIIPCINYASNGWGYVLATQALAFCLSVYVLRKFSVLCIKAVDDYYTLRLNLMP